MTFQIWKINDFTQQSMEKWKETFQSQALLFWWFLKKLQIWFKSVFTFHDDPRNFWTGTELSVVYVVSMYLCFTYMSQIVSEDASLNSFDYHFYFGI